jgi:hypothetical protein
VAGSEPVAAFERTALLTRAGGEFVPMTESWNLWEEAG